jgi:hypothetical protein
MELKRALAALEAAGTAQNRKVYRRHGVSNPLYGVSYAIQGQLAKQNKHDTELATGLWKTGNHDARILAAMIAIGIRNRRLERKALAAARRIGVVEVDHGETSCKTPNATAYIKRTVGRPKATRKAG